MQMPTQAISQDQVALEKTVLAGMKVMYDPKVFPHFMAGFKANAPLPTILAAQAAGLVKLIDDQVKGAIPKKIVVPAGVMLMIEMCDFLIKAKLIKPPSKEDLQDAMQKLTAILLKVYSAPAPSAQGAPAPAPTAPPPAAPPPQQGIIAGAMQ